ncbi:hypothetical protein [Streptomyces thermolineatus]|uniref:hypothetical protein n=1 Tax=Streptomyces thermolineatus TaxID=44033 RepID=UPI00384AB65C
MLRRRGRFSASDEEFAGQVCGDLSEDLPDDDFGENLDDWLEMYHAGSKPRCEEIEYLNLLREAAERIARGR